MLPHYPDIRGQRKPRDRSGHNWQTERASATSMNGFGGRGFEKNFESLFQSSHQNIGQLIAFVFQEQRTDGFVLMFKKTLNLVRHIICPFFTGIITAMGRS